MRLIFFETSTSLGLCRTEVFIVELLALYVTLLGLTTPGVSYMELCVPQYWEETEEYALSRPFGPGAGVQPGIWGLLGTFKETELLVPSFLLLMTAY
mgnify:FL=1